ncbi:MAG: ABC transporter permease [Armatimonadetes bacterium]|nr:ABC transporter permease [Armatimonadota bacterium]MDW8120932.1 ABC transporter permease [Armatimonadota bacterium]
MQLLSDLLQSSIRLASPVMLVALGETLLERVGLLNIGTEGTMLVGAFVSVWAMVTTKNSLLAVLSGIGAGCVWGFLFGIFAVLLRAEQVIVGAGLNFLALGITGGLLRSLQGRELALVVPLLPTYPPLDSNFLTYCAFLLAPLATWFLYRLRWGIVLRACGESPETMVSLGYKVRSIRFGVTLVAGSLMGLGGVALALGESGTFIEGMTAGQGFIALAMVVLGRWNPFFVALGCWGFGWLRAIAANLQVVLPPVPYHLILIIPYLGALAVLIVAGRRSRSPSALAQPF